MLFSKSNHLNLFDEILKLNYLSEIESHSEFKFTTFLGDSESDSYDNLGFSKSLGFDKVFIPLNSLNKNNSINSDLKFNTNGIQFTCYKSHRDKKINYSILIKHPVQTINQIV